MSRNAYEGPPLFSLGLRPFFLVAVLFALVAVPLWWFIWRGELALAGPFAPVDWHVHEMIFGYGGAVISGFLFTAVPNWTGRMPKQGWPLAALALLWLAGRLAVAGALPLGAIGVAVIDCAFLIGVAAIFLVEIVAGRNWRNLKVVVPLGLLVAANVTFDLEAMMAGTAPTGGRFGLAVIVFLIMLIGGRIVPSFTRNWLAARGSARLPAPFSRFDAAALVAGAVALAAWSTLPPSVAVASLLAIAGTLHLMRLARWRGATTWRSPLLLMLHVAYGFVPLGLLAAAGGALGMIPAAAGLHFLGIGAVGGMTFAVMIRATRGHTGRDLSAGPALTTAFALLAAAALVRAIMGHAAVAGVDGITLAAVLWTCAYAIAAFRLLPWLVGEKAGRKAPSASTARS